MKLVVSSWGYECSHVPDVRANVWPGVGTQLQGIVHRRRRRPPCQATGAPPTVRRGARYRQQREWQSMTPIGWATRECRMQFPRFGVAPHIHIVGIATFPDTVESSLSRIACETAPSERTRAHVGPLVSPLPGNRTQEAHSRACGPTISHVNRLIRAWAL